MITGKGGIQGILKTEYLDIMDVIKILKKEKI